MQGEQGRPISDNNFFSIQPYWDARLRDVHVWSDPDFQFTGQLLRRYCCTGGVMDSVPGIGLVGFLFSCDPQHPSAYCYGVLKDHRVSLPLHGIVDGIFIRFFPGEFARLFGVPCNEIPAEGIPLEQLIQTNGIAERMALATDWPTRHRLLFELLLSQPSQRRPPRDNERALARQTIELIQGSGGNVRISELERQTLYSARYLQSVMQRQIGLTPKQLCEQVRFQNALRLLCAPASCDIVELSQRLGYCDQSHFTRTFREYTGVSPGTFLKSRKS